MNEDLTEGILAHMGWVMTVTEWPEVDEARENTIALRTSRPDLEALSMSEIVDHARTFQPMAY